MLEPYQLHSHKLRAHLLIYDNGCQETDLDVDGRFWVSEGIENHQWVSKYTARSVGIVGWKDYTNHLKYFKASERQWELYATVTAIVSITIMR
jgi:hypothetical protein